MIARELVAHDLGRRDQPQAVIPPQHVRTTEGGPLEGEDDIGIAGDARIRDRLDPKVAPAVKDPGPHGAVRM
jgi:hypothetical protein